MTILKEMFRIQHRKLRQVISSMLEDIVTDVFKQEARSMGCDKNRKAKLQIVHKQVFIAEMREDAIQDVTKYLFTCHNDLLTCQNEQRVGVVLFESFHNSLGIHVENDNVATAWFNYNISPESEDIPLWEGCFYDKNTKAVLLISGHFSEAQRKSFGSYFYISVVRLLDMAGPEQIVAQRLQGEHIDAIAEYQLHQLQKWLEL